MTTQHLCNPDGPGPVFLVERSLMHAEAENLADSVARADQICTLSAESGSGGKATADAVRALNEEAEIAVDRIAAAVPLYPTSAAPDEPRKNQIGMTAAGADPCWGPD
jgi:hypothetical protein